MPRVGLRTIRICAYAEDLLNSVVHGEDGRAETSILMEVMVVV